jgi:hypothetical protein
MIIGSSLFCYTYLRSIVILRFAQNDKINLRSIKFLNFIRVSILLKVRV